MDSQRILRIPQAGSPDDFVLVGVSRVGPSELDVKLVATEGEYPYVGSGTKPLLPFTTAVWIWYHCGLLCLLSGDSWLNHLYSSKIVAAKQSAS